jgi:hypothetical protein
LFVDSTKMFHEPLLMQFDIGDEFFLVDDSLADQVRGVRIGHGSSCGDFAVHQRLRECRIVEFVVTPSTIAEQIEEDVLAKALAVLECELGRLGQFLNQGNLQAVCDLCTSG